MNTSPDLSKVANWSEYVSAQREDIDEIKSMYREAREFLEFYDWCSEIEESYVGMLYPGLVAVFLFKISPARNDVDEWIWVIVGDVPSAYLTTDECPNPAAALDGYIGAMLEWVEAAQKGNSVAELIPVNVPATKENGDKLKTRLDFLDERVLSEYQEDLKASVAWVEQRETRDK
ncbi:MAG: hypothetical protein AB1766_08545 [Pseudomonadota bacterium]